MNAPTHPRPRALEAFAGAGGAALGLRAAGFSAIACLEWDKDAAATLAAAGFPAIHGDVRAYTPTERPDLLWASPPCQAWSSAGKRQGATDERNGWPWTFDLCDRARPTWMVCENVPGLLMHSGEANCDRAGSDPTACPGCYWIAVILPEARRRFAVVEWRVLDAASFGVPQRRHRVFLVCGPTAIRWREPTHADPDTLRQGSMFGPKLQPWRTVRQALNLGSPVYSAGVTGEGRPTGPDEPTATISGKGTAYVLDTPAPALTGGSQKSHVNGKSILSASADTRAAFAGAGIRRLTVAECATLQDFPPDHPWQGTQTSRYRQVGNACCPKVVELLGLSVRNANDALQENQSQRQDVVTSPVCHGLPPRPGTAGG